jgi:hypothetical protein
MFLFVGGTMLAKTPWDLHPDLTADRLAVVAKLLRQGRNDALDRFDPSIGDDGWTLGCRAFQFARFQILEAAAQGDPPWLSIEDDSRQLVFKIGSVPVRFYRGPADEPTTRTLRQNYPELRQLTLSFPEESEARHCAYRFAVETDVDGFVTSIKFMALMGDLPVLTWDVPLEATVTRIHAVEGTKAEGVELPPPSVRVPGADQAESA